MCGIVAFAFKNRPVLRENLEAATRRLSHRGPDGLGTWVSGNKSVGLGHARLSIIDLETGKQPLANESGSIHAVVNGEFYGFEQQREELQARGHVFHTKSDSEILLHLYEDHGVDCLRQLRGEFAFVLWDEDNKLLFAARDRFGIKPLYHATVDECLYIASEAKALFTAGVPARWDHEAFYQSTQALATPDRSLFKGVYQLPPGQYLVVQGGKARTATYWDFNYPVAGNLREMADETAIERLRHELDEAVRIRLRADVPVGVYMSGGIDSNTVLGIASRYVSDLHVYSVFFPEDTGHNEESIIREGAERYGVRVHGLQVTSELVADNFAAAVTQWEDLPKSEWVVGKFLLSRLVRDNGAKVVLTGEGADEVLAGHMALAQDYCNGGVVSPQANLPATSADPIDGVKRILGFVPTLLVFRNMASARILPLLSRDFAAEFSQGNSLTSLLNHFDCPGQLAGRERLSQSMYIWSKTMLPNFFMTACGDRSEMAHSVEGRVPFLDHHVVELLRDMPSSLKVRGQTAKYVLREAARPSVLDAVYRARKKDFVTQSSRISQPDSRIGALLQDTLRGPALGANPFFDRGAVLKLLDDLNKPDMPNRRQWDAVLLNILGSCVLQKAYGL
ncbi:MAG: asparagine synthase (glutamine-hydrolyzing) [bacterium]